MLMPMAIGINIWTGVVFGFGSPPWGAAPGHMPEDIQSGTDFVHNTFMLDHPEKTVLWAPFRIRPRLTVGTGGLHITKPRRGKALNRRTPP